MAANANVALGITAQNSTGGAFRAARQNVQGLRRDVDGMAGSTMRNRRLIQQFGMQVSDFSVQVAGGQSAILAFTQQVPQFVQGFGAVGGILAMLITIFGTLALVIVKTGTALSDLTPIAGVLRSEVEWLAMAFDSAKEAMFDMANLIVNNLDRIAIAAGVTIGYVVAGWVIGMAKMAASSFTLIGALTALRVALMRFLPVAIILAITELVYQFLRLRDAMGGTAAAFSLIGDVFVEIWDRMKLAFQVAWNYIKSGFFAIAAVGAEKLGVLVGYAIDVWDRIGSSAQALVGIMGAVWAGIEEGWNGMLQSMANTFGTFMSAVGGALASVPIMEEVGLEITKQGMLAIAASREFGRAADDAGVRAATLGSHVADLKAVFDAPLTSKSNWVSTSAVIMDMLSKGYGNLADALSAGISKPMTSVQAIRDALAALGPDAQIDVRDWFNSVEEGADGAGGAAEKAAKQVETFGQAAAGIVTSGLDRLFDSMFEGGKNAISVLSDIGKELLKLAAKQQFFTALAKFMPNTFGKGKLLDLSSMIKPFAKGGVVNSPTLFPMGGGRTGMAGEAGPEAILPLTRGPNGALGVQAAGGGGGGVQVNIITPPGSTVEQSERTGPGGMTIRDIVVKEMQQATANGQMDRVNRQRYNMAPVPVKR